MDVDAVARVAEEHALDTRSPKWRLYPTVVGINQYANATGGQLGPLRCAERDAQRFADFLREENEAFDTISFTPFLGADATAERIRRQLRQRFSSQRLTALDVIVLYFAGHGMTTSDHKAFLCCYDTNPRDPQNGGVRLDDLYNEMQMRDSEATVMLILDACYSGSIADPNRVNNNAAQQMRELLSHMQTLGQGGRIILAATHASQTARENPLLDADATGSGAGIFTSEVLRGWQQGAARNHDGMVTPESLSQYLQTQFKGNRNQQPITSVTTGSSMTIGHFEPFVGDRAPVAPPKRSAVAAFDPNARGIIDDPLPAPKTRTAAEKKRQRNLLLVGAGVTLAVIAACAALTLISPAVFNLWFISAIVLAVLSLPLATWTGGGGLALVALLIALVQGAALVGLAHAHYGLGAGIGFLSTLTQYGWVAAVIFTFHVLFVVVYGAWITANALWST